jgi:hypothetical protein
LTYGHSPRRPCVTAAESSRQVVCQRLIRLVELGFPELGELFDDPTCRTAREVLRIAPTARAATRRHTSTLANANAGAGHRRLGTARAERLQAAAAETIAVPELDAEVAFEVGLLLDQYDVLERQIEEADRRRRMGVRFSVTVRGHRSVRRLIEAIPEEAWTPIPYWIDGGADVAETTYTPFAQEKDAVPVRLIVRRVKPTPGSQLALLTLYDFG